MNISAISNLIWLGSFLVGSGLGYVLYDFKQNEAELTRQIEAERIKAALEDDIEIPEIEDNAVLDFPVVKRTFHDLNWSGEAPKKPVVIEKPTEKPVENQAKPVKDLLTVIFLRVATFDPDKSQAYVYYKDQAIRLPEGETSEVLAVGDVLPDPYGAIFVEAITIDGVLFAFSEDEEREAELLKVPVVDDALEIVEVGPDGLVMPPSQGSIGAVSQPTTYRPERTTLVRRNYYMIGTQDAERFSEDYASMIAQIDHRRHRDPVTRQYDGIEIQNVPANSIAAQHGVKSGDVIKSINGHPVTSSQEAIQFAKNNAEKYKVWEIVIVNKGAERTVTYESPED